MEPFHLLLKPTGAACNLQCRYCFYLSKAELYPGASFRMPDDVLDAAIAQLLDAHPGPEVTIAWQGGEPTLMGLAFYQRAAALIERHRRPGQQVLNTMQTNGVLLDEHWAAFLAEHRFLVGLSMDGPPALHDAWRVDRGGHATAERVRHAWELLARADVDVNILCTVHAANVRRPLEVYRFFRDDLGARFLQFIPIVERLAGVGGGEERVSARSVRPGQYGRFLSAIFDDWAVRDVGSVFVQGFDAALASWVGQPSLCIFQPTCGRALVLEHNGDVYACDHFVDSAHRRGNILTEPLANLLDAPALREFGTAKERLLPAVCRACDVRFACHGECPRNRFVGENGEPGRNYLCDDYRHFFHHISPALNSMARLLRAGRPPRDAMPTAATAAAELEARLAAAGRNDPCPCGSGLKVKACHGLR
ncbi:MAG: anaerobic sulfatase maturase [Gemmatimonadetes bacterium]|nr:anaerobic sulfatase maturase [Gemmatimonadota bacterium]